jgi:hypothetical protein
MNNPAGRLLYWLEHARKQPQQESALAGWCRVWDLDQSTQIGKAEAARRGTEMILLGVETRRMAGESTNPIAPVAMEPFPKVERTLEYFTILPRCRLDEMLNLMGEDGWHSLKTLDAMFSHDSPEPTLTDEDQESLLDQTRTLVDQVLADDMLGARDKKFIVARLRDVEKALIDAQLTGGAEVERAMDGLMGGLVRLYGMGVDVVHHPVTKGVFALVGALAVALNVGADYSQLTGAPIGDLLGLPSSK